MSHKVLLNYKIREQDLNAVKRMCDRLNYQYNDRSHRYTTYYGTEPCDIEIRIPTVAHSIGLTKEKNKDYYKIECDTYGDLAKHVGRNGEKFLMQYAYDQITYQGEQAGWMIENKREEEGAIVIDLMRV